MMQHTVVLLDSVKRFTHDCTDRLESVFLSLKPLFRVRKISVKM